jgi:AMP-polyphosphate phosphotransferase
MPRQKPQHDRLSKAQYERRLPRLRDELLAAQSELRKQQRTALAFIVTGVPAAGRSETVNELLEWIDPKYVTVHAFGEPDREEKRRPPMWRYWQTLPARGRMAFYFAGWYSDYMARAFVEPAKVWKHEQRIVERIQHLESMLRADGVRVVKIHLQVDEKTQRERLKRLRANKLTRWRVTDEDRWLAHHHKSVERAAQRCLKATDHPAAPWHVVDGTDDEFRLLKVGEILRDELHDGLQQRPAAKGKAAQVKASAKVRSAFPPQPTHEMPKDAYERELARLQGRLALLVRRSRFRQHALVLAFEGMDAAGKGGAIRRVTVALDARQYQVVPVSAPTAEELSYPYLWRFWRHVPKLGDVTIFDRSWYGRLLVERVRGFTAESDWRRAYDEINEFEREMTEQNIIVSKFWLQVTQREQLQRFKARDEDPLKRFKVDKEDWVNRDFYDAYQVAAAEMIQRTDAPDAPWRVVAADDKQHARLEVLRAVCDEIERRLD